MGKPKNQPTTGADVVTDQEYEVVPIDAVKPHPDNPRHGDLAAISASVARNGFYGTIAVQRSSGRILAGNHRWEAAKAQGLTEIPVVWLDVDDKAALRILLADNRTSDLGSYDKEALAEILLELRAAEELSGTGYGELDVGKILVEMGDALILANKEDSDEVSARGSGEMKAFEYRVIIDCRDELHQTELLDRCGAEGLTARALIS
jgi:ParB-like chromosome segregation protein Spo0J